MRTESSVERCANHNSIPVKLEYGKGQLTYDLKSFLNLLAYCELVWLENYIKNSFQIEILGAGQRINTNIWTTNKQKEIGESRFRWWQNYLGFCLLENNWTSQDIDYIRYRLHSVEVFCDGSLVWWSNKDGWWCTPSSFITGPTSWPFSEVLKRFKTAK